MSDIALQPAHALAEAIRRRDLSSRELLDHYLARVDALNGPLNAVVTLDPDGARRAADAADAALARGDDVGPLHGVPMTVKDTYQTAGMRTTCGLPAWDHVPEHDAEAVRRLRGAGAVIFGKTNTPTLAGDWQTYNAIFGTSNNPWDTDAHHRRFLGRRRGRSGDRHDGARAGQRHRRLDPLPGELVRRVRAQADLGHRVAGRPSAACAGHAGRDRSVRRRPAGTRRRPTSNSRWGCSRARQAMRRPGGGWSFPPPRGETLRDLRLAVWLDDPAYPVGTEVGTVLQAATDTLRAGGARVVDARPAVVLPDVVRLYQQFLYPILLSTMGEAFFDKMVTLGGVVTAGRRPPAGAHRAFRHPALPGLGARRRETRAVARADGGVLRRGGRPADAGGDDARHPA